MNHNASRRLFLRQSAAFSTLGATAGPLALNLAAMGEAAAQSASDYRALVCVFLFGGNDSFNMVLPTDAASFDAYTAVRNQAPESIALLAPGTAPNTGAGWASPARLGGVLPLSPINPQGRSFALHPVMGSLQTMFNSDRRLAIAPNVGPLLMPTNKAQFHDRNHPKPQALFSHNDQQNTWMAMAPEGAVQGWGGLSADLLAGANGRAAFTSISAAGNAVWLAGRQVVQYQVSRDGAIRLGIDNQGRLYGNADVGAALQRVVSNTRGTHVFERDVAAISQRSLEAETLLRTSLKPASDALFGTAPASGNYNSNNDPKLRYDNPTNGGTGFNGLAQQLQVVARMIDAAPALGVRRQVFFVSLGGFDSHDDQNRNHADLMARLAHAMRYFDNTLGAMGRRNNVTTFTASDFGRTFTSNGDGTDHGWGSHHFVMGGAVRGGNLYGRFPTLGVKNAGNNNFDSSPDQLHNGSLLPGTSVDQFGATLAGWFGLSASQCLDVFPNLRNFDASARNLGFMTA